MEDWEAFEPCAECFRAGWPVPRDRYAPEPFEGVEVTECAQCGTTLWTLARADEQAE